jgi:hypothetical protein
MSRLVASVCYKELVYKVPLNHTQVPAKHCSIGHLPLRGLRGCDKRHLNIFIDKITCFPSPNHIIIRRSCCCCAVACTMDGATKKIADTTPTAKMATIITFLLRRFDLLLVVDMRKLVKELF